jgi:thiamine biosynthesis lipoprotein
MRPASNSLRRAQPHLGTFVEIAADGAAPADLQAAIDAAFDAVATVHRLMSRHDDSSDIGRLNRAPPGRVVALHPWTYQVLATALELHRQSDGAFDIAVATTRQGAGPAPANCPTIELLPGERVRRDRRDLQIDLDGIAKGFAVDRAVDILMHHGVAGGLVNAGGDLRVCGGAAHRIHIRDPRDPRRVLCALDTANEAVASSGVASAARTVVAAIGTVIDPRSRTPVSAIHGASVRAPSCLIADALTKIVMVAGEAAAPLLQQYQASALFVSADGVLHVTADWQRAMIQAA